MSRPLLMEVQCLFKEDVRDYVNRVIVLARETQIAAVAEANKIGKGLIVTDPAGELPGDYLRRAESLTRRMNEEFEPYVGALRQLG